MSRVEKYRRILEADPGSMVFVELARALLDERDAAAAVEVCQKGLVHNPDSIIGRAVHGRALLAADRSGEALEEFERAVRVDPENPFAFNLVADALAARKLYESALPYARAALELQTGDERATARVRDIEKALAAQGEKTEEEELDLDAPPAAVVPAPVGSHEMDFSLPASAMDPAHGPLPARMPAAPAPPPLPPKRAAAPKKPPPLPRRAKEPEAASGTEPETRGETATGPAVEGPSAEEQARIYEAELREKLLPVETRTRSRTRPAMIAAVAIALALVGAAGFLVARGNARERDVVRAIAAASNAVARDSSAGYLAAVDAAQTARELAPDDATAKVLLALAEAALWREHDGDAERRARAVALLSDPAPAHADPETALLAQSLLAEGPAGRAVVASAAADLLARMPRSPVLHDLAGRAALASGDAAKAAEHFNAVFASDPAHVRTLIFVGENLLDAGEPAQAHDNFVVALQASPGNPRAVAGKARALLAQKKTLAVATADVEALLAAKISPAERALARRVRAELWAASGRAAEAAGDLAAAADEFPDKGELPAALAAIELSRGRGDQALAAAAAAVKLEDSHAHRLVLARAQLRVERFEAALETLGLLPENVSEARLLRGVAREALGRLDAARADLESTGTGGRYPAEAALHLALIDVAAGDAPRAAPVLQKLGAGKAPRALALVGLGRIELAEGRVPAARKLFQRASDADPLEPEGPCSAGRLEMDQGQLGQAVAPLTAALRRNPHHAEARLALARVHLESGDPASARAAVAPLVDARPSDARGAAMMAEALASLGNAEEARRWAERALAADAKSPLPHQAAGRVALYAFEGRAALRALRKAVALAPQDPVLQSDLGEAYLLAGDATSAKKSFEEALRLAPGLSRALVGLGRAQLAARKNEDAARTLEKATSALSRGPAPRLALARASLALALLAQGKPKLERAARAARDAVAADGRSAMAHWATGQVAEADKRKDDAHAAYARAAELAPAWSEPRKALARLDGKKK